MLTKREENLDYILCYTRLPQEEAIYSPKLAYSMHLGFSEDGKYFKDLNHNSGVLFAKATDKEDGTLNAKSLKNPYIFYRADNEFGVVAVRTEPYGENDKQSKGKILFFTSSDLLQYKEVGLIDLKTDAYVEDVSCQYEEEKKAYIIKWSDEKGNYYKNYITDITSLNSASASEKAEAFTIETC